MHRLLYTHRYSLRVSTLILMGLASLGSHFWHAVQSGGQLPHVHLCAETGSCVAHAHTDRHDGHVHAHAGHAHSGLAKSEEGTSASLGTGTGHDCDSCAVCRAYAAPAVTELVAQDPSSTLHCSFFASPLVARVSVDVPHCAQPRGPPSV